MLSTFNEVKIFSGQSSRYLAEQIAEYYGQPLGEIIVQIYKGTLTSEVLGKVFNLKYKEIELLILGI